MVISKALLVISALAMASSLLLSTAGVESTMAELILVTSARVSTNEKIPVVVWRNFIFEGAEDVTNV